MKRSRRTPLVKARPNSPSIGCPSLTEPRQMIRPDKHFWGLRASMPWVRGVWRAAKRYIKYLRRRPQISRRNIPWFRSSIIIQISNTSHWVLRIKPQSRRGRHWNTWARPGKLCDSKRRSWEVNFQCGFYSNRGSEISRRRSMAPI